MWGTIATAIKSFCDMLAKFEETQNTAIERQSETTVNKSAKNASKAIKAANKALDIAIKYANNFEKKDYKDFKKYKKDFDNNIGSK